MWIHQPTQNSTDPYQCVKCLKWFKTLEAAETHYKAIHVDGMVECDICRKLFSKMSGLRVHMHNQHPRGQTPHSCLHCRKSFANPITLKRHQDSCQHGIVETDHASSASSSESSTGSHPEQQPISMRDLLGGQIHQAVENRLSVIESIIGRLFSLTLPETPSPAQSEVLGRNLSKFRDAQYVNPLAAITNPTSAPPLIHLRAHMNLQPYRTLHTKVQKDETTGKVTGITISNYKRPYKHFNYEAYDVVLSKYNDMDDLSANEIARCLQAVLERIPTYIALLSVGQKRWAEAAAQLLAFDRNKDVKLYLPSPTFTKKGYRYMVKGYDPSKNEAWSENIHNPIGSYDLQKPVDIPNESRIVWTGERHTATAQELNDHTKEEFDFSYKLAQFLTAKFYGYIGKADDCQREIVISAAEFWIKGKQQTKPLRAREELTGRKWTGEPFFDAQETEGLHLTVFPKRILTNNMKGGGHTIIIDSVDTEKIYPVLNAMLEALKAGHDADTVWGVGSLRADLENVTWGQSNPIMACNNEGCQQLHLCPECRELKTHDDLKQVDEFRYYAVCSTCKTNFEYGLSDKSSARFKMGALGYHIWAHLKNERKHSENNKTDVQLRKEQEEVYQHLLQFQRKVGHWSDVYIVQELDPTRRRETSWDGQRLNPLYPSIEAVDPCVQGPDGKTAYHVKDNMVIVSDSINRAKHHWPPIVLHGVLLFQKARLEYDQILYESAVSLFRIALVNHYEYGDLGAAQQGKRIGQIVPSNMDDIKRSFREPLLLTRTQADETVFRYTATRTALTQQRRARYEHIHHDWLMRQLELIAQDVFGTKAQDYEDLYLRPDAAGKKVFFPFSQYSIVEDWTEWDLFELLSERAIRCVTVCQAPHSKENPAPPISPEELFLTVANLWLRMLKKDIDAGVPRYACGSDETHLVPQPNLNSLLRASLGHRYPGQTMHLGLSNFVLGESNKVHFDPNQCHMFWETWFCNSLKFKYAVDSLDIRVFPQLKNIRRKDQVFENPFPPLPRNLCRLPLDLVPNPFQNKVKVSRQITDSLNVNRIDMRVARQLQRDVVQRVKENHVTSGIELSILDDLDTDVVPPGASPKEVPQSCRNMSNLGATCYASVIFQVLANVKEFQDILRGNYIINLSTGRSPLILTQTHDEDGQKHMQLYTTLAELCVDLKSGTNRLPPSRTIDIMGSLQAFGNNFANEKNDSAIFLGWLLDRLQVVTDMSQNLGKDEVWERTSGGYFEKRHAYSPEEELNFEHMQAIRQGRSIESIQIHTQRHWIAHLASGYRSPITDISAIQFTDLYDCSDDACPMVYRDIGYDSRLILSMSRARNGDEPTSLRHLITACFEETFMQQSEWDAIGGAGSVERARSCNHCLHQKSGQEQGELLRRVRRITKASPIFAVEIQRHREPETLPENFDLIDEDAQMILETAEFNPYLGRITGYGELYMNDWVNDGPAIREKIIPGAASPPAHEKLETESSYLSAIYEPTAIVAYSHDLVHYIAFVKVDGQWIYFNDLDQYPKLRNPFTDWPDGFCESMIVFRATSEPPQNLGIDTVYDLDDAEQPEQVLTKEESLRRRITQLKDQLRVQGIKQKSEQDQLAQQQDQIRNLKQHQSIRERSLQEQNETMQEQNKTMQEQNETLQEQNETPETER